MTVTALGLFHQFGPAGPLLEAALDAVVTADAEGHILGWNAQAERVFGWQHQEVIGRSLTMIIPEVYRAAHKAGIERYVATGEHRILSRRFEISALRKTGEEFPIELTVSPLWTSSGILFAAFIRDLSDVRRAHDSLHELASSLETANANLQMLVQLDPLTEILNRRGMETALGRELIKARERDHPVSAVMIDCDTFEDINNRLGYAAGDVVLREITRRIQSRLRASDHFGRVGSDEFLVLLPGTGASEAGGIAERLRMAVPQPPIVVLEESLPITVSAAVLELPRHLSSLEELLGKLHRVVRQQKHGGRNRTTPGKVEGDTTADTLDLILAGNGLRVAQQKIVHLADPQKIEGYEMLVRGPEGPLQRPDDLFRASRERHLTTELDLQCLRHCIRATAALPPGTFHLNLLPSTFLATPIEQLLELFVERRPGDAFCLEICEQQIIGGPSALRPVRNALKRAGFLVGIDDVGFGRSPIEGLLVLEPDVVKIDRSVIRDIGQNRDAQRVCRRLVRMLRETGATIVAEGVETEQDRDFLLELEVVYAQGYHFAYPVEVLPGG